MSNGADKKKDDPPTTQPPATAPEEPKESRADDDYGSIGTGPVFTEPPPSEGGGFTGFSRG